ncbi:MAG: dihydropteroate synthase [Armatimonadota bacterium]|nr:dihydropteroate synthase [Armatimonadota bacterium]
MIIVGERINGNSKRVREAVVARSADFIAQQARLQVEAGADYVDVNAGTEAEREPDDMVWLVETVQAAVDKPLCIDSANPAALRAGLQAHKGQALVNSVSAEEVRLEPVLDLVKGHGARVVALTLDDSGLPKTAQQRIAIVRKLAEAAERAGVARQDLFIDPLARAVGLENEQGAAFLDAVAGIRDSLPGAHVICGLSNVSFQMPARRLLNRTFLAMAMARGLDAAILDPLDAGLMAVVCAGEALLGQDEMCLDFIQAYRSGRLEAQT